MMIMIGTTLVVVTNYLFFPTLSVDLVRHVASEALRTEARTLHELTTAAVKGEGSDVNAYARVPLRKP